MSLLDRTFQKFPIDTGKVGCQYPPPREKLLEMLKMEEFIRMSPEYSEECTKVKDEVNGWLRISEEVQQKVAYLYGYQDPLSNLLAVNCIRRAPYMFPEDPEFSQTQVYVRNNLANLGNLEIGTDFPNVPLIDLSGEKTNSHHILNPDKYNVIIASSATWQPFRAIIDILNSDIVTRFESVANFKMVYISEAHAADVWPIGLSAGVINYKHQNISDRINCAKNMKEEHHFNMPIVVDSMNNTFRDTFAAWPFRAFIVKDNVIQYISNISDSEYDILELYQFLGDKM